MIEHYEIAKYTSVPFWIAGGACLSHRMCAPIRDIDVYSPDPRALVNDLCRHDFSIVKPTSNFINLMTCDKKSSLGYIPIQVIINQKPTCPEQLFKTFDFTVCCIAYNGESYIFGAGQERDYTYRQLVLNNVIYPLKTLRRVKKYQAKGFAISDQELLKLSRQVIAMDWSKLNLDDFVGESA